jgi:hypothetical protein
MFKTSPAALGVAAPHPSGHGAAHALFQRGEFRETDLAEVHSPTITEMARPQRRPSLAVKSFVARLKSIHSGVRNFVHSFSAPFLRFL